jgi:hypothetical protein
MVHDTDDFYESMGGFASPTPSGDGGEGGQGNPNPDNGSNAQNQQQQQQQSQAATEITPKSIFGEDSAFASWDEVKTKLPDYIAKANEYEAKKQELEDLRVLNQNPFANETIAGFNEFVKKTGIADFQTFNYVKGLQLEAADPIEIMVADRVLRNPELIGKEAVLRKELERQHGIEDNGTLSQDEIDVKMIELKEKAKPLRETLKQYQDLKFSPISKESIETAVNTRFESVKPKILSAISDIATIPIEAADKDGKVSKIMDFAIPAEFIAESAENMAKIIAKQGIDVTEQTLPNIRAAVINNAINANFKTIMHAAIKQREQEIIEQFEIDLDNPSAFKDRNSSQQPRGSGSKSFESQLFGD